MGALTSQHKSLYKQQSTMDLQTKELARLPEKQSVQVEDSWESYIDIEATAEMLEPHQVTAQEERKRVQLQEIVFKTPSDSNAEKRYLKVFDKMYSMEKTVPVLQQCCQSTILTRRSAHIRLYQ